MSELGEKLIGIVRRKAAERPSFIYERPRGLGRCAYVYRGEPSCLIGQALWEAGLIGPDFEHGRINLSGLSRPKFEMYLPELQQLTDNEWAWLRAVQAAQDASIEWGRAVSDADQHYFPLYALRIHGYQT